MSARVSETAAPAARTSEAAMLLAPADRFFLEVIPLAPGMDADTHAELAIEESSPFPLAQLYYGHLAAPDGASALVFAAYRRRFSREETGKWDAAGRVVPEFLALIGEPPASPAVVVHAHSRGLTGVAWDGKSALPVMVRSITDTGLPTDAQREEFATGLRSDCGLRDAEVQIFEGEISVQGDTKDRVVFSIGGMETARFTGAALESADIRDKVILAERRLRRRSDLWLWRALLLAGILVGAAAALEAGVLALNALTERMRIVADAQEPDVRRVETAQTLAVRIEDLATRQLRPFEMLGVINERRPPTIQFLRVVTTGLHALEVEAQTPIAGDIGQFETALRTLASLERVETRDLRTREGRTTFVLSVTFKPGAFPETGGPS